MKIIDLLFGRALPTWMERAELVGVATGVAIFGLDALSSAAYGPEAALTILTPLGALGSFYILPISMSIIVLLCIVYFSYRQTIAAYPGGGGSYTVASENLGAYPGLLAAAALMIDYILTVAVGISAGVGALVSALPNLLPHTLLLCLAILVLITLINLRGIREAGIIFMIPTYIFIVSLLSALGFGVIKAIAAGGHPIPVEMPPPPAVHAAAMVSIWLVLQAFASGCTAMTGVEAVSNGVRAFAEPTARTAQRTLTVIIGILIIMLAAIAYLVRAFGITATPPGQPGYQSVLSLIIAAVAGRGTFYFITIGSVLLVLALSANTAFADFPRLCRAVSENGFLPNGFGIRGRRLVYAQGVYALAVVAGLLLIFFRGVTDRLIPLYAVGAFLAFTLSQAGMVTHWRRVKGPGAGWNMFVNGIGAVATGITVLVVLVAKFVEGAWITALLIPALLILMFSVRRHFKRIERELQCDSPLDLSGLNPPFVVVPVQQWGMPVEKALRFALTISKDIEAVHVPSDPEKSSLQEDWSRFVESPATEQGLPVPKLVTLPSPYRYVVSPIVDYVLEAADKRPGRRIAVVVPELVEHRWYHYLLHDNRAEILKGLLLLRGDQRIVIITVPWYLRA
jgi:amino acid transporter